MADVALNRRQLGRDLSVAGRASAAEILRLAQATTAHAAYRVGLTGPPGAGKSSLLARLTGARAAVGARVGVLAIDPTSPLSGGSILGDRVRMDENDANQNVYIRSVPSRAAQDGLTSNVVEMLNIFDRHHFDELFVETVGVGQTDHAVRALVDTVVLVMVPESGDAVQAMKAGILEMADIYVVNKADRPHAERMYAAIESVLALSPGDRHGWKPRILLTSATNNELSDLDDALAAHRAWLNEHRDADKTRRERQRLLVHSIFASAFAEISATLTDVELDADVRELYQVYLTRLAALRRQPAPALGVKS